MAEHNEDGIPPSSQNLPTELGVLISISNKLDVLTGIGIIIIILLALQAFPWDF